MITCKWCKWVELESQISPGALPSLPDRREHQQSTSPNLGVICVYVVTAAPVVAFSKGKEVKRIHT